MLLNGLSVSTFFSLGRLHVYAPICFFSTVVGLDITDRLWEFAALFTIGLANTLALVATCAFNDVEDAYDDMSARTTRNVIAQGKASRGVGYLVASVATALSIILAIINGVTVCLIILAILVTTFLYSWRCVRLKSIPFLDVLAHAVTGGLIFLSSAWSSGEGVIWGDQVLPICLIFASANVFAVLIHQLYDYEDDLRANIKTTVIVLGKKATYWTVGGIFFLFTCLIMNEFRLGVFSLIAIMSFPIAAGGLILLSLVFSPERPIRISKRIVPWAVNTGAAAAIIMWYLVEGLRD